MLSTTNTVVALPSPQQPSASVTQTSDSFVPAPANGWNQDSSTVTTKSAITSTERVKSFFDFRPLRTGSNEAVVGDNSTNIPGKNQHRLSTFTNTPISALDATKPRSLSAGRTRPSGGVDLVQDIYDRLGITRGELSSTKSSQLQNGDSRPSFLNYRNVAMKESTAAADSKGSATRGRSTIQDPDDTNDDGHIRSRSLSRGRQFRSIWPPSENRPASNTTGTTKSGTSLPNPHSPKYRGTDVALEPISSPNQLRSKAIICSPDEVVAVMLSPSRLNIHRASIAQNNDELLRVAKSSPIRNKSLSKTAGTASEDKTGSTEVCASNEVESAPSGISVKERMRAFSEPTKTTTNDGKKTKSTVTPARNYPPLIDIFAEEKKRYQNENIGDSEVDEEKKDDDVEYSMPGVRQLLQRQNNSNINSPQDSTITTPRGKGAGLANAFLASIQTSPMDNTGISPRNGPTISFSHMNEIATDDQGSALDTGSVSMLSSVGSHDEQNHMANVPINRGYTSYNGSTTHVRKPSWLDNHNKQQQQRGSLTNKPSAGSNPAKGHNQFLPSSTTTISNSELPKQSASTSIVIERMVEERVQARVAELERRMEQQMRTYMEEMEAKMASIIAAYEKEK